MKIDFSEIEKGFRDSLEKSGGNAENFLKRNKYTPAPTVAPISTGFHWADWQPPDNKLPPIDNKYNELAPSMLPFSGDFGPPGTLGSAGYQVVKAVSPTAAKALDIPGQIMDVGTAAKELVTGPPKPEIPGQPGMISNAITGTSTGLDRTKTILQNLGKANSEGKGFPYIFNGIRNVYNRHIGPGGIGGIASNLVNKAQETWQGLGDLGQAALPLGGAALAYYLMNRRKKQQAQQQPININIGGRPIHPMFDQRGVASFGQDKFGQIKQANIVVDSLANAVRSRMANKVIDKVVAPSSQEERPSEHSEKEIELTSKYPEMSKLLEDKQNKAYLERLLKE